jgi:hypothetical protein
MFGKITEARLEVMAQIAPFKIVHSHSGPFNNMPFTEHPEHTYLDINGMRRVLHTDYCLLGHVRNGEDVFGLGAFEGDSNFWSVVVRRHGTGNKFQRIGLVWVKYDEWNRLLEEGKVEREKLVLVQTRPLGRCSDHKPAFTLTVLLLLSMYIVGTRPRGYLTLFEADKCIAIPSRVVA